MKDTWSKIEKRWRCMERNIVLYICSLQWRRCHMLIMLIVLQRKLCNYCRHLKKFEHLHKAFNSSQNHVQLLATYQSAKGPLVLSWHLSNMNAPILYYGTLWMLSDTSLLSSLQTALGTVSSGLCKPSWNRELLERSTIILRPLPKNECCGGNKE